MIPAWRIVKQVHNGPFGGFSAVTAVGRNDSAGHLTQASMPVSSGRINVESVGLIPGTASVLAGGFTLANHNPGNNVTAVLLQYGN